MSSKNKKYINQNSKSMKMVIKKEQIIFTIALLISLFVFGSCTEDPFEPDITGTIEGKVLDAETNEPISNVTITTKPSTEVKLTDASGSFKIANVDTGEYNVIAEKKNYERKMLGILLKEDQTTQVKFLLNNADDSEISDIQFTNQFSPENGVQNLPPNVTLSWEAYQEENEDSLSYDVNIFKSNSLNEYKQVKNIRDTFLTLKGLHYNSVYYWQVIARNKENEPTNSKMLSFQTRSVSENSFFFVKKVDGNYELMAYNPYNETLNQLTFNGYRDWAPKINRQSNKIAFVSDSLDKPYIYTMDINCNNIQKVTDIEVDGYHNQGNAFDWDESRGKIIFSHYSSLYEINSDGTELNKITSAPAGRHFREINLSPDNNKILALTIGEKIYHSEIYLMDRDGSNQRVLIDSLKGIVDSPTFSVDGKSILYTHDVSGNESQEGRMLNSHIFKLNIENNDTTDLSDNKPIGTNDMNPTYSPTGNKIIFTNTLNDNSKPKDIWMMNVDGTNREKVLKDAELPYWN